jgi:hypothetical protein
MQAALNVLAEEWLNENYPNHAIKYSTIYPNTFKSNIFKNAILGG